jgi:hypothetical protein
VNIERRHDGIVVLESLSDKDNAIFDSLLSLPDGLVTRVPGRDPKKFHNCIAYGPMITMTEEVFFHLLSISPLAYEQNPIKDEKNKEGQS